jgi:ATP-dependent helicase/nuclease subunit B
VVKEIWLGPLLSNNRSRLIARCAELVSQGKSNTFIYLAASHPLLELVTEQVLDGAQNPGVWGEPPVYLFRGFVSRILSNAIDEQSGVSFAARIPVDREELPLKRSLISQILKQLAATEQLKALNSLAHREGCVNTIANLIGEIQRAAKTPDDFSEIVSRRAEDFVRQAAGEVPPVPGLRPQIDFDRDVGLIYSTYFSLLEQHNLTEADADQLRALALLRGDIEERFVRVPWLEDVRLLIVDGFYDFTPIQGELLRELIRRIPDVIVNLNRDERNPGIFEPYDITIDQLQSIADFEVKQTVDRTDTNGALSDLRDRLFKSEQENDEIELVGQQEIRLFTCTDRETEIRKIAKEVKRLVLQENYRLSDIALVVRERSSYADTIARVLRDEAIPCNMQLRIKVTEIPAVRAARKLFEMLEDISRDDDKDVKVADLADLIKSEYFRLDELELGELGQRFDQKHDALVTIMNGERDALKHGENFKYALGIGRWDPDTLENTIAFVGGGLSMKAWRERARKLIANWPQVKVTTEMASPENGNDTGEEEPQIQDADKLAAEDKGVQKKRRPSRDVHPAAIAWAVLVLDMMADLVRGVPRQAAPRDFRVSLMSLLERLQFSKQISRPVRGTLDESELPHLMLDLRGLESLRRAFAAAVKSIEMATAAVAFDPTKSQSQLRLSGFLAEVTHALDVEIPVGRTAERAGLRVLEATDVRGLRFRAMFIAGLVEGGFPLRVGRDWIYPHEERERLKRDYGLTLEDLSPATLLKEEHYFYQCACRATDSLYLSRPLLLEDDYETVASYYINELAQAISPFQVENEYVRRDFDGAEIFDASTVVEFNRSLIRQDERHRHKAGRHGLLPLNLIDELRSRAVESDYLKPDTMRLIDIERVRAGLHFGPYDGQITTPELVEMLRQRFGPQYVHSASGLSTYGNCAYRFFANRVLRLEPRGEAALDLLAIDAGKLLHDVLRRFFERYRGQKMTDLDREPLREELQTIADQVFGEHERAVPPINADIWKIDCEIRKVILDQVLLYELGVRRQTPVDVRSSCFEIAFGLNLNVSDPKSKPEQLELRRSTAAGDQSIKIQGQIDRVDEARDGTLIAYDYKLTAGTDIDDMKAGRSLQLPIYLEALENLLLPGRAIAGGGYYILRAKPGRRNNGIYRKDFAEYLALTARNSILSDSEWAKVRAEAIKRIWEFLEGMTAGDFRVRPSQSYETCKFCDYYAVCRYEKYRMDLKEKQSEQ